MNTLFNPLKLRALTVPNRPFMALLSRCRGDAEHVRGTMKAQYYAQHASAGLSIVETTMAMDGNSVFRMEPGIYAAAQVGYPVIGTV